MIRKAHVQVIPSTKKYTMSDAFEDIGLRLMFLSQKTAPPTGINQHVLSN